MVSNVSLVRSYILQDGCALCIFNLKTVPICVTTVHSFKNTCFTVISQQFMVRKITEIISTEELKVIYYKFDILKRVLNYIGPYHLKCPGI